MANKPQRVKVKQLGIGAIFVYTNPLTSQQESWKIIGRPYKSGKVAGKPSFYVPCLYQKQGDEDVVDRKDFNIEFEVGLVRGAQKDFDAIDQRDQPKKDGAPVVQSIEELAPKVEVGAEFEEDTSIEEMIK